MTELTIDGGEVNSNPHFSLHKLLLTGSPCVALVQWAIPHALLQLIILFTVIIEDIQELSENRSSIPSAATCSMEQKRNKKNSVEFHPPPVSALVCTWVWRNWYLQRHDTKNPKNHKPDPNKLKAAARLPFTCFFPVCLKMIEHDTPQNRKEHDITWW
jgi:hypothetical protein